MLGEKITLKIIRISRQYVRIEQQNKCKESRKEEI